MQVRPFLYNILKLMKYHTFLPVPVAKLSTLKQVRFFGPPCTCPPYAKVEHLSATFLCLVSKVENRLLFAHISGTCSIFGYK